MYETNSITYRSSNRSNTPNQNLNESIGVSGPSSVPTTKKRNSTPRSRPQPKATASARTPVRNKVVSQFSTPEEVQSQQPVNDPSRYAIANQAQPQQQINKVNVEA